MADDETKPLRQLTEQEAVALEEFSNNVFRASEVAAEITRKFGPHVPPARAREVGVCKKILRDGSVKATIPDPEETEAFSQRLENLPQLRRQILDRTP